MATMILCIISPKHHDDLRSYYMCIYIIYIHRYYTNEEVIQPLNWVESLVDWLLRFGVNFRWFFDRVFRHGPMGPNGSSPVTSGVARFEGQN